MSPTTISLTVFACSFGGALLGVWLRTRLPAHHLDAESKDTVKIGIGLVATMTALVLGLVTASAKSSFDALDGAVKQTAMDTLALDRALAQYGPETAAIRKALQTAVEARVNMIWPPGSSRPDNLDPLQSGAGARAEGLAGAIRSLEPADDAQRELQSRAMSISESLLEARWLVMAAMKSSIPVHFLAVIVFWLMLTFTSFGLFAPRNGTVYTVLFVCAVSVASAVFLVLELDGPFEGFLRVSPEPMQYALAHLNQ